MQAWSMIAAATILAAVASGQRTQHESPTMVLPISATPLLAETIEEYVSKSPDGTSESEIGKSKYYRDADGRMRVETESLEPFGDPIRMIELANPIEGFIAVLEPQAKLAHRLKFSKSKSPEWGIGAGPNGLAGVSGKTTQKTEDLGKQSIAGVECTGSRTTTTSDDQPSLIAVDELWMSKELGLIGLVKHSGPDSEMTSRIQNVDLTALFVIPADYRIRDMEPIQ
jgi:hypothetical protein